MDKVEIFRKLHQDNEILHLGNVWDVQSALMFEKQSYKAIGTSSLAIANSLGYEDGENLSFHQLCEIVKQIILKVDIPLSVDIEAGYSRNIDTIIDNIVTLYDIGVVGVNIEDSIVVNGNRNILQERDFANILKTIKRALEQKNIDLFINARTDYFIMGLDNPLEATIKRIKLYEQNGANGIFIPCVTDMEDIKKIVQSTTLPVNIMAMPQLLSFDDLRKSGVKRISQGPFVYQSIIKDFEEKICDISKNQSFSSLF